MTLPEMQPRDKGLYHATVRKYQQAMEAGEVFPPILLARVNGALVLTDGWHRLEAARGLNRWEVEAEERVASSMAEARLWGYEANRTHGLPLTSREVREAGPSRRLAGEVHRALDAAGAAIPGVVGVVDAEERWELLEKVRGLVEALEGGDLHRPLF